MTQAALGTVGQHTADPLGHSGHTAWVDLTDQLMDFSKLGKQVLGEAPRSLRGYKFSLRNAAAGALLPSQDIVDRKIVDIRERLGA